MMQKRRSNPDNTQRVQAAVFAALGDETRLGLVLTLARGNTCSISELTAGSQLTRQAIRKHLHVLETAGMVRSVKWGRENRFEFRPQQIAGVRAYLDFVSNQWDAALGRLKALVQE